MKFGIWIPTCKAYRNRQNLAMETWVPAAEALGIPVVFYDEGEPNKIYNPKAGDRGGDYNLAAKMKRMFWLCLECHYDFVFRADTDTYIWPDRLLQALVGPWANADYVGKHIHAPVTEMFPFQYASGMGYLLSARAMRLVLQCDLRFKYHGVENWDEWAEDRFVGRAMHERGIPLLLEPRITWNERWDSQKFIAWHDFGKVVGQDKGCPYLAKNEPYGSY